MAIQEHRNGEETQTALRDNSEPMQLVDESRRRFTKAGVVASGVLFTLGSQPVLGTGWVCKSPSGFLSGNLSNHGTPKTCSGRTPGYWQTRTQDKHKWPLPYKTGTCTNPSKPLDHRSWSNTGATSGTMFKDASLGFRCTGRASGLAPYSMMQVLLLGGNGDPHQLGAHCVAALLNARKGWTPVLTEAQIRNMFNEYDMNGFFAPTAGVKWYPEDIVAYLKTTMTL